MASLQMIIILHVHSKSQSTDRDYVTKNKEASRDWRRNYRGPFTELKIYEKLYDEFPRKYAIHSQLGEWNYDYYY